MAHEKRSTRDVGPTMEYGDGFRLLAPPFEYTLDEGCVSVTKLAQQNHTSRRGYTLDWGCVRLPLGTSNRVTGTIFRSRDTLWTRGVDP